MDFSTGVIISDRFVIVHPVYCSLKMSSGHDNNSRIVTPRQRLLRGPNVPYRRRATHKRTDVHPCDTVRLPKAKRFG